MTGAGLSGHQAQHGCTRRPFTASWKCPQRLSMHPTSVRALSSTHKNLTPPVCLTNLRLLKLASRGTPRPRILCRAASKDEGNIVSQFFSGDLPKNTAILLALLVFSRLGVYIRLPGVDVDAFAASMQGGGLLGYIDTLSGGSISRVGVFSLGIVPYINASILLQLLATLSPSLKRLQREEGRAGRARFELYQKLASLGFAVAQAVGQLTYLRPYVPDFSLYWLASNSLVLTTGAMILVFVADTISELKLGNGTSVLIFANIASALPSSVGAAVVAAGDGNVGALAAYILAFLLTTLGIVYVQEAERQIPMAYGSRYKAGGPLSQQAYLPFKVNATGVLPVIFASSLLAVPSTLARFTHSSTLAGAANALGPGGAFYLPVNVALIVGFNYLYTFLQFEPKELSEQLKKQGASIPGIRPGRNTAAFITQTLARMSVLGSAFLGALAIAPAIVEGLTGMTALRGFAGTSVLILVGVATDTARKFRAELAMGKYKDIDALYDNLDDL
ncbi:SECY1 [Auxenochlorella protothecoides x Auxenochlorella symbiontica]